MKPFFSIVIPVYNGQSHLEACLNSVFQQHGPADYEVIVVDDESTDRTRSIARRFVDRITLLEQPFGGVGVARNRGIEHARGEYVLFLDCDDLWLPWTLDTYRAILERHGQPDVISGVEREFTQDPPMPDAPGSIQVRSFPTVGAALAAEPLAYWYPSGMVVRRSRLIEAKGFSKLRWGSEDTDLWFRLGRAQGMIRVTEPLTFLRRRHPAQFFQETVPSIFGVLRLIGKEFFGAYWNCGSRTHRIERILQITQFGVRRLLGTHDFVKAFLLGAVGLLCALSSPLSMIRLNRKLPHSLPRPRSAPSPS